MMWIMDGSCIKQRLGYMDFPSEWTSEMDEAFEKNDTFSVIYGNTIETIEILQKQKIKQSNQTPFYKIKPKVTQRIAIHNDLTSYFCQKSPYFFDGDLIGSLQNIGECLFGIPIALKITENEGITMDYIDLKKNHLMTRGMNAEAWKNYKFGFLDAKEKLDIAIRMQNETEETKLWNSLKTMLLQFLEKIGLSVLLDSLSQNPHRHLQIFFPSGSFYFPFEILFANALCSYHIPTKKTNPIETKGFLLCYDPSLANAAEEAMQLIIGIKSKYKGECIIDKNFDDYRESFLDASVFHFMGHGKSLDNKGHIMMNGKPVSHIMVGKLNFAFLNSCYSGLYAEGIIQSFLEQGAKTVVASAYAVTDDAMTKKWNIEKFYQNLDLEAIEISYYLYQLQNKGFSKYYRLFGGYNGGFSS